MKFTHGLFVIHGVETGHAKHMAFGDGQGPCHGFHGVQTHEPEVPLGDVQRRERGRQLVRVFRGDSVDLRDGFRAEFRALAFRQALAGGQRVVGGFGRQGMVHGHTRVSA